MKTLLGAFDQEMAFSVIVKLQTSWSFVSSSTVCSTNSIGLSWSCVVRGLGWDRGRREQRSEVGSHFPSHPAVTAWSHTSRRPHIWNRETTSTCSAHNSPIRGWMEGRTDRRHKRSEVGSHSPSESAVTLSCHTLHPAHSNVSTVRNVKLLVQF